LIVGAGYIGLDMAEALTTRGLHVTLIEQLDQVMPTIDADLAQPLADHLREHRVTVHHGTAVHAITAAHGSLCVDIDSGSHRGDIALVVTGVQPDTDLAATAGATLGARGTVAVDRRMRTNLPDIYAAGDCVHTYHRLLDDHVYLPLGNTAHKQGRVAGANAVGGDAVFAGSLGTQAVKVFDLVAASTGLRDNTARMWRRAVLNNPQLVGTADPDAYVMCLLTHLHATLRRHDKFADPSLRWVDPRSRLNRCRVSA
jgi:NADPH-dependent 2,4-dienoyl-CoA reductase/sulfur reductase-like enzyme